MGFGIVSRLAKLYGRCMSKFVFFECMWGDEDMRSTTSFGRNGHLIRELLYQ